MVVYRLNVLGSAVLSGHIDQLVVWRYRGIDALGRSAVMHGGRAFPYFICTCQINIVLCFVL